MKPNATDERGESALVIDEGRESTEGSKRGVF
jgi:hypothetical protein